MLSSGEHLSDVSTPSEIVLVSYKNWAHNVCLDIAMIANP